MNKSKNKNMLGEIKYKAKKSLPILAAVIVGIGVSMPVFASKTIPNENNTAYNVTASENVNERRFRHGRTADSTRTFRESNRRTRRSRRAENGERRESRHLKGFEYNATIV